MKKIVAGLIFLVTIVLTLCVVGFAQAGSDADSPGLTIVKDGESRALIVIPNDANMRLTTAGNTVANYIRKASGAQVRVMKEGAYVVEGRGYQGYIPIFIGDGFSQPVCDHSVDEDLANLKSEGFVIYPCNDRIHIVGPSIWGTLNGVYEFLERYVGVRWLMFGDVGEDVPNTTTIVVSQEKVRMEPAFDFRVIGSVYGGDPFIPFVAERDQSLWAHRNKLQGRYNNVIEFHHNLGNLISSSVFGASNPEFFPGGNPPAPGDHRRWQPCFTAEGIADAAAERIIQIFNDNPDRKSYSLGVNDIGGYCESRPGHPARPDQRNSIGLLNMSDIYYQWVNDVVEKVTEVHPDKWFGLLAYQEVMDPPSFPLHPRVIPFITKDRMAWLDEGIRAEGHGQMDAWNEVAHQIGWYDYMYGRIYFVPRVYPRLMGETMRYAAENNVFGLYTEMNHVATDGPKAWLLAKLLWDPSADVEALLRDWYERAVGPQAAEDLAAFFDLWERFWTERMTHTSWFNSSKRQTYLAFFNPDYLSHVTPEDIEESVRLLDSVIEKAETDRQRARAQLIRDGFELHRISALSYSGRIQPLRSVDEALAYAERLLGEYARNVEYAERRYDLVDEYRRDVNLTGRTGNYWYWWSHWNGWSSHELQVLINYLRAYEPKGGPVTDRLTQGLHDEDDARRTLAYFIQMALGHYVEAPSLIEKESLDLPLRLGDSSSISVTFERPQGLIAAQVHFKAPAEASDGSIRMELIGKNRRGEVVMQHSTLPIPLSSGNGDWYPLTLIEVLPSQVNERSINPSRAEPPGLVLTITEAELVVTVEGAPSTDVYIDDLVVYQHIPADSPVRYRQESLISGRRNPALGKFVRESSYRGDYYGERAVDGNWMQRESRWLTGTPPPHWLEIDLNETFTLDGAEVWTGDPSSPNPSGSSVSEFQLQYWDGENWIPIPGASIEENRSEHVVFEFEQPVTTNRVRFYSEAIDDGALRVREIILHEKLEEN